MRLTARPRHWIPACVRLSARLEWNRVAHRSRPGAASPENLLRFFALRLFSALLRREFLRSHDQKGIAQFWKRARRVLRAGRYNYVRRDVYERDPRNAKLVAKLSSDQWKSLRSTSNLLGPASASH